METHMKDKTDTTPLENHVNMLKEIAQKLGKRTSPLNLIDPQVNRTHWDWRDVLTDKSVSPGTFTRKLSYKINDLKVMLRVNDEYLVADLRGSFDNSVICSFVKRNVHNPNLTPASASIYRDYGYNVFIDSNLNTEKTLTFIQKPAFKNFVKRLQLSANESLHIGRGYANLYLQRFACDEVLNTLDIIYQLLDLLPKDGTQVDLEGLPEEFTVLIPWIKRWAISDDEERSEKISRASSKTLSRFVQVVSPNFNGINKYLDSFEKDVLPEHAILLGTLAECATEAQLILKARE